MYTTTRNILALLLVVMTAAMLYGFSMGETPDTKALLALMYGLGVGMGVCIALLVALPAVDMARKSLRQPGEPQPRT